MNVGGQWYDTAPSADRVRRVGEGALGWDELWSHAHGLGCWTCWHRNHDAPVDHAPIDLWTELQPVEYRPWWVEPPNPTGLTAWRTWWRTISWMTPGSGAKPESPNHFYTYFDARFVAVGLVCRDQKSRKTAKNSIPKGS